MGVDHWGDETPPEKSRLIAKEVSRDRKNGRDKGKTYWEKKVVRATKNAQRNVERDVSCDPQRDHNKREETCRAIVATRIWKLFRDPAVFISKNTKNRSVFMFEVNFGKAI
jgi:hypothetical protein